MRELIHPIEELFEGVVMAAFAAAAVVLLVWLVDRVAGKRLSPGIRAALWLLVAARLVMPTAPDSALSVQRVWGLFESEQTAVVMAEQAPPITQPHAAGPLPAPTANAPAARQAAATRRGIDWDDILFWALMTVWPAGVVWVMLRAAFASARFAWRLRSCSVETTPAIVDVVLHACDELGVRRPRIKRIPGLDAPALFGLLRPTLCLPADCDLTPDELRMIALHEAAHLRRRDCLVAWLLTPVRALHWCNPVAWLSVRRFERYREQACDEAVRRRLPPSQLKAYVDLLLRFASASPAPAPGLVGIWFARSARELGARIEALNGTGPTPWRAPKLVGVALIALAALMSLTDPAASRTNNTAAPQPLLPSPYNWNFAGADSNANDVELRTYDLTDALAKIEEVHPEAEDPRSWLLSFTRMQNGKPRALPPVGSNRVAVRATGATHQLFSNVLDEVARCGHTWQVTVSTRVIGAASIDDLPGVDWTRSVAFPATASETPELLSSTLEEPGADSTDELCLSTNSITIDYSPFFAAQLDAAATTDLINRWQAHPRRSLYSAPKVTLFSGQQAMVRDQSQTPFVVGVDYVRGEFATAAQPNIAVLSEGAMLDVLPRVLDDQTLDLICRLELSHIDDLGTRTLPGQDLTVQTPRVRRQTLNARCRMNKGQTLLMAPLPKDSENASRMPNSGFYYAVTVDWFADTPVHEVPGVAEDAQ